MKLPKRVTPQQDADERILAALLRMAVERDSQLTEVEQAAKNNS